MDNYIGWKEDTQVFTQFNSAKKRKNAAQGDIFFLLFVWAFSSTTKPTKANWAKASLVWAAIGIVISFIITIIAVGISSGY